MDLVEGTSRASRPPTRPASPDISRKWPPTARPRATSPRWADRSFLRGWPSGRPRNFKGLKTHPTRTNSLEFPPTGVSPSLQVRFSGNCLFRFSGLLWACSVSWLWGPGFTGRATTSVSVGELRLALGQQPDGVPPLPLPGRGRQDHPPTQGLGIHLPLSKSRCISLAPITNPSLTPGKANSAPSPIYPMFLRISPWLWFGGLPWLGVGWGWCWQGASRLPVGPPSLTLCLSFSHLSWRQWWILASSRREPAALLVGGGRRGCCSATLLF